MDVEELRGEEWSTYRGTEVLGGYLFQRHYIHLITVQPATTDSYKVITKALAEKQTEFHTYQPTEERSYREVLRYSSHYSARLTTHPNDQILTFMDLPGNRRLRRHVPNHLPNRFLL
jgi:hypothetical protein